MSSPAIRAGERVCTAGRKGPFDGAYRISKNDLMQEIRANVGFFQPPDEGLIKINLPHNGFRMISFAVGIRGTHPAMVWNGSGLKKNYRSQGPHNSEKNILATPQCLFNHGHLHACLQPNGMNGTQIEEICGIRGKSWDKEGLSFFPSLGSCPHEPTRRHDDCSSWTRTAA